MRKMTPSPNVIYPEISELGMCAEGVEVSISLLVDSVVSKVQIQLAIQPYSYSVPEYIYSQVRPCILGVANFLDVLPTNYNPLSVNLDRSFCSHVDQISKPNVVVVSPHPETSPSFGISSIVCDAKFTFHAAIEKLFAWCPMERRCIV